MARDHDFRGAMSVWDTFLHWARRLAQEVDLDKEERDYKLALASRLAAVRDQVITDDPDWPEALRRALTSTNLLNRFYLMADRRLENAPRRDAECPAGCVGSRA